MYSRSASGVGLSAPLACWTCITEDERGVGCRNHATLEQDPDGDAARSAAARTARGALAARAPKAAVAVRGAARSTVLA